MSSRVKKPKFRGKSFECTGEFFTDNNGTRRADTSANIYESMLLSRAYKDLKTRQQQLYTLCKAQYYGKRKPKQEYKDIGQFQDDTYFFLNIKAVVGYGLYTDNMRKEFYGDMKALEEHGFIKTVSSGRNTKKKTVYQYSDEWRTWNPK